MVAEDIHEVPDPMDSGSGAQIGQIDYSGFGAWEFRNTDAATTINQTGCKAPPRRRRPREQAIALLAAGAMGFTKPL